MIRAGELNMRIKWIISIGLAGFILSACGDDKSTSLQDSLTVDATVDTISNYDLGDSVIPFPNDFLFAPNEDEPVPDGTLNIPLDEDENKSDLSNPKVAMNGLDGFSTVAPMTTGFSAAIDANSISGLSVRLYPIIKADGPLSRAIEVEDQLDFGVDYIAALSSVDPTDSTLAILPLKPLDPKSSYAVVLTSELKSTSGNPVGISGSYALTRGEEILYDTDVVPAVPPSTVDAIEAAIRADVLKPDPDATDAEIIEAGVTAFRLEEIRLKIVQPTEALIVDTDTSLTSADIILHWTFTTQSTTDVLAQLRSDIRTEAPPETAFLPIAPDFNPVAESPLSAADIHVGTINIPYYLAPAADVHDPSPLFSFWKAENGSYLTSLVPDPTCLPADIHVCVGGDTPQTIPLMISIPKSGSAPWPVVIYQHGITTNRATMLAVADTLAAAGMAVVAIDMPMHGLTGNEIDGTEAFYTPGAERTFNLDLATQDSNCNVIAATPDGVTDCSGTHYVNLANLQNTRDNLRQSVSDLFNLTYALTNMDYDGGGPDFDSSRVYFLGHSLGAMVGTTFLAHEESVRDAALAFGGTSLAKILDGSATFGPTIEAGLAALPDPVIKGTPDYESFLGAAQTVIDSGDPVNHATAAAEERGILFFEIVGNPPSSPSDLVVPNTVPDSNDESGTVQAPLAGTEQQLTLMDLIQVNTSQGPGSDDLKVVTKFISGYHGSLLDPTSHPLADPLVTEEIQKEAASFLASDGTLLNIANPSVLQ